MAGGRSRAWGPIAEPASRGAGTSSSWRRHGRASAAVAACAAPARGCAPHRRTSRATRPSATASTPGRSPSWGARVRTRRRLRPVRRLRCRTAGRGGREAISRLREPAASSARLPPPRRGAPTPGRFLGTPSHAGRARGPRRVEALLAAAWSWTDGANGGSAAARLAGTAAAMAVAIPRTHPSDPAVQEQSRAGPGAGRVAVVPICDGTANVGTTCSRRHPFAPRALAVAPRSRRAELAEARAHNLPRRPVDRRSRRPVLLAGTGAMINRSPGEGISTRFVRG